MPVYHEYEDAKLRETWMGYVEGNGWTLFIPAVGGAPVLWMNEAA